MRTTQAADLHRELLEQVGRLRRSDGWLAAMVAAARFHAYSFGNWLLLWSQAEQQGTTVTRPAGYRTWQQLGRQVRRGELGYRILAPMTRRASRDNDDAEGLGRVVTGFRVVSVFDVSQTDGEPLPDVGPRLLDGAGNTDLLQAAIRMVDNAGYRFGFEALGGPNGQTRPGSREVIIEENLGDAQRAKTTVHELAHVLMHATTDALDCRGQIEVEAESVAYVVCTASGLDTSTYSVPYIAGWAETTADPDRTLLASAERIVGTARRILEALNRSPTLISRPHQTSSSHIVTSLSSDMMAISGSARFETTRKEQQ